MATPDDDRPATEALGRALHLDARASFEALYTRLAPALYAWAVLRAPRGIDAGDVLGETWLRAVSHVHEFDPARASFRTWLFGIAKKVLLHELRERARRDALGGHAEDPQVARGGMEALPEAVTSLSHRLAREDTLAHFLKHVAVLSREDRELVLHCGLEGSTCRETATRLGISEDSAIKRWQRLRAELRNFGWVAELFE